MQGKASQSIRDQRGLPEGTTEDQSYIVVTIAMQIGVSTSEMMDSVKWNLQKSSVFVLGKM